MREEINKTKKIRVIKTIKKIIVILKSTPNIYRDDNRIDMYKSLSNDDLRLNHSGRIILLRNAHCVFFYQN